MASSHRDVGARYPDRVGARSPDRAPGGDRRSPRLQGRETFGRPPGHGRETVPQPRAPKPAARWRHRWGGLIFLAVLAGLLAFCHGCHGDIDDELLSLGWWLVG